MSQEKYPIRENEFGYQEVHPMPSAEELQNFYSSQYFNSGTYAETYPAEEVEHKNIFFKETEHITGLQGGSVLDIGCGEGFSLNYFAKKGWAVKGVDFTDDGVNRHYPDLLKHLEVGDVLNILKGIADRKEHYDLIICNNVIEHVTDPSHLLKLIANICSPKTVCRFQVPNDHSWLQKHIVSNNLAKNNFWICPPGHLTYFNTENFLRFLKVHTYSPLDVLGDFPIELFLLNEASNYKLNPKTGSSAHQARLAFDNLLSTRSIEDLVTLRRAFGKVGLGRNTIVYCTIN